MLRRVIGYQWALTAIVAGLIMLMMIIVWLGTEAKDRDFGSSRDNKA